MVMALGREPRSCEANRWMWVMTAPTCDSPRRQAISSTVTLHVADAPMTLESTLRLAVPNGAAATTRTSAPGRGNTLIQRTFNNRQHAHFLA